MDRSEPFVEEILRVKDFGSHGRFDNKRREGKVEYRYREEERKKRERERDSSRWSEGGILLRSSFLVEEEGRDFSFFFLLSLSLL